MSRLVQRMLARANPAAAPAATRLEPRASHPFAETRDERADLVEVDATRLATPRDEPQRRSVPAPRDIGAVIAPAPTMADRFAEVVGAAPQDRPAERPRASIVVEPPRAIPAASAPAEAEPRELERAPRFAPAPDAPRTEPAARASRESPAAPVTVASTEPAPAPAPPPLDRRDDMRPRSPAKEPAVERERLIVERSIVAARAPAAVAPRAATRIEPRVAPAPVIAPAAPPSPKLVIGRIDVEVIPSAPPRPAPRVARPAAAPPAAPSANLLGSLRFGLGQS